MAYQRPGMRATEPVVSPLPSQNEVDATGQRSRVALAEQVLDDHKKALDARRSRDLLSEKYLLHIDGSGDMQWSDIVDDQRVEIPLLVSMFRKTENVLRIIIDNAVAHHTTMQLNYHAQSPPDRESRDKAMLDTLWINDLAIRQDFNGLYAESLYMAMASGFCPVHGYWREDAPRSDFEGVAYGENGEEIDLFPGMIDCWVGNPFGTVFNLSAKRRSVVWCSYERVLPADLVRRKFAHVPGVAGIQGSTKIPSATEFQRIARDWMTFGLGRHGSPVLQQRRDSREEVLTVICREIAPFTNGRDDPGRLQIIAVPGEVDLRRTARGTHQPILLADQPLPGRDFSWTNFYSHHRGNDIHGKPWVEDLDQLQVDMNIALSKRWEQMLKMANAPIVTPGGAMTDDMADLDGYALLELEPSVATWRPTVMEWPASVIQTLDKEIEEKRSALYTIGGYQAASRGESPGSRTPYRAILALQQADNTIHGPVNQKFQRSACDFARRMHSQMRFYGDVPWIVTVAGDDYAHLAEPYIDATRLSERPPQYVLVNAFGSSPELRAQEILELMAMRGADGEPFMTTAQARRNYPNQTIFGSENDPGHVKRRRAKTIASRVLTMAANFREQTGFDVFDPRHPWIQQAAQKVFMDAEMLFPRLRDDMLEAHIDSYSEVIQDETADPIARVALTMRQDMYYQWQAMMAGIPVGPAGAGSVSGSRAPGGMGADARGVAAEMGSGGNAGGTTLQESGSERTPIAATAR